MTVELIYYDWSPDSMLEVILPEPDNFLKVRETLTRIGVASRKDKTLYQSCHILHKQGRYFIVHFKELFALDGKEALGWAVRVLLPLGMDALGVQRLQGSRGAVGGI